MKTNENHAFWGLLAPHCLAGWSARQQRRA
jgi:hypothetical protein